MRECCLGKWGQSNILIFCYNAWDNWTSYYDFKLISKEGCPMNKETKFLLKYAKVGVLESLKSIDEIEAEELKQEFIKIKTKLSESKKEIETPKDNSKKPGEKKESAMRRWWGGIGDRQRKYREAHKEDVI